MVCKFRPDTGSLRPVAIEVACFSVTTKRSFLGISPRPAASYKSPSRSTTSGSKRLTCNRLDSAACSISPCDNYHFIATCPNLPRPKLPDSVHTDEHIFVGVHGCVEKTFDGSLESPSQISPALSFRC